MMQCCGVVSGRCKALNDFLEYVCLFRDKHMVGTMTDRISGVCFLVCKDNF